MALILSPYFDLTTTYFLIAGIAGINPACGTLGSVCLAQYAVQAGLPISEAEGFVGAFLTEQMDLLAGMNGVTPEVLQQAVIGTRWAYAEGLKWVWISSIPFGVCTVIACLFLGSTKKYMTGRVAAELRH